MGSNGLVVQRSVTDFFDIEAKGSLGPAESERSSDDDSTIGSFVVPDSQCSFETSSRSSERLLGIDVEHVDLTKCDGVVDGVVGKLDFTSCFSEEEM